MQNLYIEETRSTPKIDFNYNKNQLIIEGQSYPENAFDFYEPIKKWLAEYLDSKPNQVNLYLNIPYINTSSSKCLMDILDQLEASYTEGAAAKIIWHFNEENESEKECAAEFLEDLTLPFEIIGYVQD